MSHSKVKAANKDKPVKPQTTYFRLRAEKMAEYKKDGYEGNKTDKFTEYWQGVSEKQKKEWKEQFDEEMEEYHKDLEAWKTKHHLTDEDIKEFNRKKKQDKETSKSRSASKRSKSKRSKSKTRSKSQSKNNAAKNKSKTKKNGSKSKNNRSKSKRKSKSKK